MAKPKYRKYINALQSEKIQSRHPDLDVMVETPAGYPSWRVTARRARSTAGGVTVEVRAPDEAEARRLVTEGGVPGLGLGWVPVKVEAIT